MVQLYILGIFAGIFLGLAAHFLNGRKSRSAASVLMDKIQGLFRRGPPDYFKLSGVPPPKPLPEFDIDKALPRPYRPFRWEYHQTMSLKKLEPDWWIELESTYRERIDERKQLYAQHGKKVIDALEGSEFACRELMEMVIQYICMRYPNQFRFNPRTGVFENNILKTQTDTHNADPLMFLMDNIPEDFLVTQKDHKTGLYYLRAGVVCSALGWNVATKIDQPLHGIHGPIPDYKEKMQFSMDRFFSKMPCDKPIQRGSWGLEIGKPLFMLPEDPHFALRDSQNPNLTVDEISLRVDWQTLRRLPRSDAIIFNYKALFTPVTQLRNEPYVPRLLVKVLREGNKSIMAYKGGQSSVTLVDLVALNGEIPGTWHIEHVIIPTLEAWAKEQEEKGWVPKDWKERTLNEDPFFPGWKEQWNSCYSS